MKLTLQKLVVGLFVSWVLDVLENILKLWLETVAKHFRVSTRNHLLDLDVSLQLFAKDRYILCPRQVSETKIDENID